MPRHLPRLRPACRSLGQRPALRLRAQPPSRSGSRPALLHPPWHCLQASQSAHQCSADTQTHHHALSHACTSCQPARCCMARASSSDSTTLTSQIGCPSSKARAWACQWLAAQHGSRPQNPHRWAPSQLCARHTPSWQLPLHVIRAPLHPAASTAACCHRSQTTPMSACCQLMVISKRPQQAPDYEQPRTLGCHQRCCLQPQPKMQPQYAQLTERCSEQTESKAHMQSLHDMAPEDDCMTLSEKAPAQVPRLLPCPATDQCATHTHTHTHTHTAPPLG